LKDKKKTSSVEKILKVIPLLPLFTCATSFNNVCPKSSLLLEWVKLSD
jgi:hypothetical protein